jgi:MFS transporter, DHA2 family, multidrug resistance protein
MAKPITGATLVMLTISLSLGIFMNVLDTSIANVSIPYIAGDVGVSPDEGTWVITSFAVTSAIGLPLTGWLAQRFGEVRLFVACTFLFTVFSMFCGFSVNLPMLIVFRVLQGAAAGPMIPLSQSILLAAYPESKKGFATSLWAMTAVVAPVFGPILGGWITYNYSWPWIFFINLPVGIFSCVVTGIILAGRETPVSKPPIDIVGLILLIVGIGCLQILLDKGNDLDWFNSRFIIILTIISTISLCFFVAWELTEKQPIVDLTLFKIRNFAIGTVALSLGYLTFFANIVVFPLWLQTQENYTATWAGLATAPIGILSVLLTPFVGLFLNKIDPRIFITLGFLAFASVFFWCAHTYTTDISFFKLVLPRFFMGIGIAFFFTPLIIIVISGLPAARIASALGTANFLRILGGSFGTSISVTLWDRRAQFHHSRLVENINQFNPVVTQFARQLQHLGLPHLETFAQVDQAIYRQAFMLSTNDILWVSGVVFLILLGILWFTRPPFFTNPGAAPSEG